MAKPFDNALDNLCGPGKPLQKEPFDANEFAGLLRSGIARLKDARNATLALESRFDLAYNAAHSLSLACAAPLGLSVGQQIYRFSGAAPYVGLGG